MAVDATTIPNRPIAARWLRRGAAIAWPLAILAGFWLASDQTSHNWLFFNYLILSFGLAAYIAVIARSPLRELAIVVAAILLGLAGIEAFAIVTEARPSESHSPGFVVSQPILGWGAEHPGVFHQTKLAARTRAVIVDVDYTIDGNRNRKVDSAHDGPTVAFFGDSMTFGEGLPDSETLPQLTADAYERRIRVLNFGFPGYGPQQFLRALETGIYDKLLRGDPRLFIYETAAWHAERTSCLAGFVLRAPHYEMVDGRPAYQGSCYQRWWAAAKQAITYTSLYRVFFSPLVPIEREDIELYIAILARAGELARAKYGVPTLVLYLRTGDGYLKSSGYTDAAIMQRMQESGLAVIDAELDPGRFPGQALTIPDDGHPTGAANAARAALIKAYIERTKLPLEAAIAR